MNVPAHIVLVGCGFAGTTAFYQLVKRRRVRQISIFESSGEFGPGYPYQTDECADYLINNTTDTMCLEASNRRAFVDWLAGRPDLVPELDERGHLPRSLYGRFLKDVFEQTLDAARRAQIDVQLIPQEATGMCEADDGTVRVSFDEGYVHADAAILTTGRCPDRDDYEHPPAGSGIFYFPTHVMTPALDNLPIDAAVHVLGASLSAYDVINRLYSETTGCSFERADNGQLVFRPGPNQRTVALCSRSGRLKAMQSASPHPIVRRSFTKDALRAAAGAGLTLAGVCSALRQDADDRGAAIDWARVAEPYAGCYSSADVDARAAELLESAIAAANDADSRNFLVDFFDDAQIDIWDLFGERLLRPDDERQYRERFETAVLSYAAPCPVPTAERLLALARAGRLRVVKGVKAVRLDAEGGGYRIEHEFGCDLATALVNATGSVDRNVESDAQPALVQNLVSQGLLRKYSRNGASMNGAAVDMGTFRATGARNIYVANMLLWGPGFFVSSALMMATIVERILDGIFGTDG